MPLMAHRANSRLGPIRQLSGVDRTNPSVLRSTKNVLTPHRARRDHANFISIPRQELNEIRHGFKQHIFVDLYCATAFL